MQFRYISKDYDKVVSKLIQKKLSFKQKQKIILTGGKTIVNIYSKIKNKKLNLNNQYFFSDERCVKKNSKSSNFYNVKKNLFKNNLEKVNIERILSYKNNKLKVIKIYKKNISKQVNLMILSLGQDGHLASIFNTNHKQINSLYFLTKNKRNEKRITLGKRTIARTRKIIILVKGKKRGKYLDFYFSKTLKIQKKLQLNLFKNSLVILDNEAYNSLSLSNKNKIKLYTSE